LWFIVSVVVAAHIGSACTLPVPGISIYKPEKCDKGYTLLTSFGAHESPPGSGIYHGAILIDMEGRLVNAWEMVGMPAKMLPGGHVMGYRAFRGDGTGHIECDALVVQDWHGNEIWRWDEWGLDDNGNPISRGHHDFQREGNPVGYHVPGMDSLVGSGKTLILSHSNVERPDIAPWTLEDDIILEVDHAGNILWEWHAVDHYDAFGFDNHAKVAMQTVRVIAPEVMGGGADVTDWLHVNSMSYLGPNRWWDDGDARFHPENIIVDARSANIIWIIDKATGEIVWRVGPDYSFRKPEAKLGQIIGQHHAHLIPRGLPGEGNILVFDNGGGAGFGTLLGIPTYPNRYRYYSRVIEFNPVTLDIVWEYERQSPAPGEYYPFYSFYISGAQRLPNGNTLITEGYTGRVFEVTASGELVWEYVSLYHDLSFDTLPGLLRFSNTVYRSYRVPYDSIPDEYVP
jgi:hypothetical protein